MLKKLKHKFILINMLMVGLVIIFIFTAVCILTYRSEKNEIKRSLEQVISLKGKDEIHIGGAPEIGGVMPLPYVYAFSVLVDENGEITGRYENGADMDEDVLASAVGLVMDSDAQSGTLRSFALIYMKKSIPNGTVIAFASLEPLKITMKNTVLISVAACLSSLLIFLYVSNVLAGFAIKPIAAAWRQQKQFVADASHDLKTPLTVILANTGILMSHKEQTLESQLKWIESTEEEAQYMRGLVDRMLELAKSEDMGTKAMLSDLDISELSQRVILQFEPVAFERQVTIESDIAPEVRIKAEMESYVRLIHILIDNAIKYSPEGGRVTVRLSVAKQTARLSVHNEGDAIPAEDLPHIFERFYRADKARGTGGYGLGLSIAKNIAEAMGGKISAESSPARGTVFTVLIGKLS